MGGIAAPCDAGGGEPLADAAEIVLIPVEAGAERWGLEQGEDLGSGEAALAEVEEAVKGIDKAAGGAEVAIGDGEREGRLVGGVVAENGFDEGCVGIDIGGEDEDLIGAELGILLEEVEQLVAQDLQFAERMVAAMDAEGVVWGRQGGLGLEIVQRALDGAEKGIGGRRGEEALIIGLGGEEVVIEEEIKEIAALHAPCGEEGMGVGGFGLVGVVGRVYLIAPEARGGLGEEDIDLMEGAEGLEDGEEDGRQGVGTEDGELGRQVGDGALVEGLDEFVVEVGAVFAGGGEIVQPEEALPALVPACGMVGGEGGVPGLPCLDPIRAVGEVLVEEVGEAAGELEDGKVGLVAQVIGGNGQFGLFVPGEVLEAGEEAGDHGFDGEGGVFGLAEGIAEKLLDEGVGGSEVGVGEDAATPGEFEGEPASQAVSGDDDGFGEEGRRVGPVLVDPVVDHGVEGVTENELAGHGGEKL